MEVSGARVTPITWERDEDATGTQFKWKTAIYTVTDLAHPDSTVALIQWVKRGPHTGAWLAGEFIFRTMTAAAEQALRVIAAREGRWADLGREDTP
jgi:hypothetical protein